MDNLEQIESTNILAWMYKHQIKNERGVPMEFDKFAFMIDPYLDWTPLQGVNKASQCGWSTMTNLKLCFAAKHGIPGYGIPAANVIYTLPSDSDVNVFVPSKTNLLIKQNPIITEYIKGENANMPDVDSIQRKKIGNSMVYFKGTRSKTAALMLTSDLNIHDESDRSEKSIIEEYESRNAQSLYKGRWIFSNPSAPNMPADLMYQDSDQKHWFIKCEHCGHWQYLDWFKLSEHEFKKSMHCFIDDRSNGTFQQPAYVCGNCCRPISDENRKRGKWVNKEPFNGISGYWVSHLMYSWMSAKQLLKTEQTKSKSYFMNFVLGKPYVGSDVAVDGQVIVNNIVLDQRNWTPGNVAMGVDNGDIKHYVIGDKDGIFEIGKTKSWDDIEFLIQKYQPTTVIDLNPYPNKPRELADKYRPAMGKRWRVYCSYYVEETKDFELIEWGQGERKHMVYPARNQLFDDLIAYIASGNMKFFKPKQYWEEYIAQWETLYRADLIGQRKAGDVASENTGVVRGVWLSTNKNDHYAHATLYYYVALSKIIQGQGQVLQSHSTIPAIVQKEYGRIPLVGNVNFEELTIDATKPIIKKSTIKTTQVTRKPGSSSGTM